MNGDEPFLSRWSRRKSGAAELPPSPPQPVVDPAPELADASPAASEEIDLSHLPPIDEIDALTDITKFLVRGVPAALQQAAMRRAWSADPVIRDFIEVAENQWDFASGAIPGFGPLVPEAGFDAAGRALASRLTPLSGDIPEPGESATPTTVAQHRDDAVAESAVGDDDLTSQETDAEVAERAPDGHSDPQNAQENGDNGNQAPKPRHGSALPA